MESLEDFCRLKSLFILNNINNICIYRGVHDILARLAELWQYIAVTCELEILWIIKHILKRVSGLYPRLNSTCYENMSRNKNSFMMKNTHTSLCTLNREMKQKHIWRCYFAKHSANNKSVAQCPMKSITSVSWSYIWIAKNRKVNVKNEYERLQLTRTLTHVYLNIYYVEPSSFFSTAYSGQPEARNICAIPKPRGQRPFWSRWIPTAEGVGYTHENNHLNSQLWILFINSLVIFPLNTVFEMLQWSNSHIEFSVIF